MQSLEQENMEAVYKDFDLAIHNFSKEDPTLSQVCDKPDLKGWKAASPDGSGLLMKMEFTVDFDIEDVYKMVVVNENRHLWDSKFHNYDVVQTYGPGDALIYYGIKTPFMVTNRDMLTRRHIIQQYGGYDYLILINSQESELKPHQKGYVRGYINRSFIGIKKTDNGRVVLHNRFSMNFGGSIPVMVLKSMSSSIPKDMYKDLTNGHPLLKKKGLL